MKTLIKPIAFLLISAASLTQLKAQDMDDSSSSSDNQNIIIHKKGAAKEKLDIVIDGDKITVNGKPVDEFKSANIDITKDDGPAIDMDFGDGADAHTYTAPGGNYLRLAPAAPQVREFRNDMMHKIKSNAAFLGVMSQKTNEGAKITEVTKESSAEKAGLKENDVITKIDKETITGPDDLYKAIGAHKPNDKITVTYLRNGKQSTAQVTLGKSDEMRVYSWNSPDNDAQTFNGFPRNFSFTWNDNKPRLGIEAQDTEDGNGVKITDISDDDSPAAKAGLKEDDIITQVNGNKISSVDELKESMKNVKKGDTLKITYKRKNETQTADIKFPKDLKTADL